MDTLPPLGITFYAPDAENFKAIAAIRRRLEADGIPTQWATKEWNGKRVDALDVFANANLVANYLRG